MRLDGTLKVMDGLLHLCQLAVFALHLSHLPLHIFFELDDFDISLFKLGTLILGEFDLLTQLLNLVILLRDFVQEALVLSDQRL